MNRRVFAAALVVGAVLAAVPAGAQGPARYVSVSVDVGPLRAKGLGDYADVVGATLQRELQSAFADRIGPGGPKLVVRLTGISQASYVGGESYRFGAGTPNDYLEGEALVVGPRGEILRRHPQLSALPASSGGAWYDPDSEGRRLVALAAHYAGWLRRALG